MDNEVRVIDVVDGKFIFYEDRFRCILSKLPSNMEIGLLSIAGEFRKGKSFLLNFFLQYLRYRKDNPQATSGSSWIQDLRSQEGFQFKSGIQRETTGINVWRDPFVLKKPNGQDIAILVMDSQGLYDQETSENDNVKLFTIVSIMSSTLMMNTPQQINFKQLSELKYFLNYASTTITVGEGMKLLQTLLFVIRDFDIEEEFGFQAGQNLLDAFVKNSSQQDVKQITEKLIQGFQEIKAFTLPHPGDNATRPYFDGSILKLNTEFVHHVTALVTRVIDEIEPRKLLTCTLTASTFVNEIRTIIDSFNDGLSPFEISRLQQNQGIKVITDEIDKSVNRYTDLLVQKVVEKAEIIAGMSDSDLESVITHEHTTIFDLVLAKAREEFNTAMIIFIGENQSCRKTAEDVLRIKIQERFKEVKNQLLTQTQGQIQIKDLQKLLLKKDVEMESARAKIQTESQKQEELIRQMKLTREETETQIQAIRSQAEENMTAILSKHEMAVESLHQCINAIEVNQQKQQKEQQEMQKQQQEEREKELRVLEKMHIREQDQLRQDLQQLKQQQELQIRQVQQQNQHQENSSGFNLLEKLCDFGMNVAGTILIGRFARK